MIVLESDVTHTIVHLNLREFNTLLAALNVYEAVLRYEAKNPEKSHISEAILDIATDGGSPAPTADFVEWMGDKLNRAL